MAPQDKPRYSYSFLIQAMLEANFSAIFALSAPLGITLLIVVWPLAIFLLLIQFLFTLLLLPAYVVLIPLSYVFSNKNIYSYYWMICYGLTSSVYLYVISNFTLSSIYFFPILHSVLVGFFIWLQVDKRRYMILSAGANGDHIA